MNIKVSISEAQMIRYGVEEMANRRAENAIDFSHNKEMAKAASMESLQMRALAQRISEAIKKEIDPPLKIGGVK